LRCADATEAVIVTADQPTRPRARHLYELDILRILTFACVIAVHTISHTAASDDIVLNGLLTLVHFTRNVFFALTGFVLMHSYLARPVPMRKFWPRRFLLVGIPYLVWSALYVVVPWLSGPRTAPLSLIPEYFKAILTGTAYYHMYFVLVTMQIYLIFPLLVWLVRKTRGHHVLVVVISMAIQVILSAFNFYKPGSLHWINTVSNVSTYQGFIVLGAVLAAHASEFLDWVRSHRRLISVLTALTAVATLVVYVIQWENGLTLSQSANPVQPSIMVWSLAIGLAFLAIGTTWADRRKPGGRFARVVELASDRSFGIFLAHPLVLWFLLWVGNGWLSHEIPRPWLTLVMYVAVVAGSIAVVEVARRSPLSLALTGRPFDTARARGRDRERRSRLPG
jgi:peptidoglycan/LPS O-acetylase OafA/YrhL